MKTTQQWYRETVGDDSVNAVALKSGLVQPTLNRHVKAGEFTAEEIIAIARAYGVSVIRALTQTGYLVPADVAAYRRQAAIESFSDLEIADEVWKRMVAGHLDEDGEPVEPGRHLSVVADIPVLDGEPIAALKSSPRSKEHEQRESE